MRFCFRFITIPILTLVFTTNAYLVQAEEGKFDSLKRFSQVLDLVERHYVDETTSKELLDGAIKGMLEGLDPHSTFMTPDEYKDMQETTSGEFSGVGIEISQENGQITVVSPIEDTPAFRAGLLPGDIILSIDGKPTQELTLQEVVSRIRGTKGTAVELSIVHPNSNKPETISIIRDSIPLISVKYKELEPGYHWLRITRFSERTTDELHEAIEKANKKPIKGIVLDMRNNPGGLVDEAVSVADTFLAKGNIVSIRGRDNSSIREYSSKKQDTDLNAPMVVLVNAGSASASEIVAGALRDHKRAIILGEKTFGKGSVQNIIPLSDGSGLKLTVALYYTPDGNSIQAEGITPDLEIPFEPVDADDKKTPQFVREKDLSRHLGNKNTDQGKDDDKSNSKDDKQDKVSKIDNDVADQLAKDNQLRMALQFVKSLPALQKIQSNL